MDHLLTTREAAQRLKVSEVWLKNSRAKRNRGRDDAPPYIRFGGSVRYSPDDLNEWVERHRVSPMAALEASESE